MITKISSAAAYIVAIPNRLTDRIGMYRLVTLSLCAIFVCSLIASGFGLIAYSISAQLLAVSLALGVALVLNIALAKLLKIHANHESAVITALILYFMMIPYSGILENWALIAAIALAIISKYLITYRRQHIFNAAAFGAVALVVGVAGCNVITGSTYNTDIFSWWVSNPILFWPVLVAGMLIVSKVRRWSMVGAFIGVGLLVFLIESYRLGIPLLGSVYTYFFSFPTLFLAFFMLTEPFTMPPKTEHQIWYGAIIGALSSTILFAPILSMTPELALVAGNAFAYTFRIRRKLFLKLQSKRLIATDTWEFTFAKPDGFSFEAGQYVEWMLPHEKKDSRGTRRYFTIASSPTEPTIRLALKIVPSGSDMRGSTYKQALMALDEGQEIIVSQLAGDFTLPKDPDTKLAFIAGGIGVTPFSSHLAWMRDSGRTYSTHLYYCANTTAELAYRLEFEQLSQQLPLVLIPVIAKEDVVPPLETGFVTAEMLSRRTPDYKERVWYISGPPGMVNAYTQLLKQAGVPRKQIHTDFFPGLA